MLLNSSLKIMLQENTQELKLEIKSQNVDMIKWIAGMLVAQAAVVVALQNLLS